jgi:hypothetical protein
MTDGDWRDGGFTRRRPSAETLAWVAASMGRGSRVVGHRRLTGGVCSAVHRLTVERRGQRTFVELAVSLHALDLPAKVLRPWTDSWIVPLDGLQVPAGARKPAVWKAAFDVMAAPAPTDTAVFPHGDFLPVNLLWSRGSADAIPSTRPG